MEAHEEFRVQPTRRGPSLGVVVFLAVLFGLIAGFGGTILALWAGQQGHLAFLSVPAFNRTNTTGRVMPVATGGGSPGAFAQVADQLEESVVNINTLSREENPFALFFGGGPRTVSGLGTGVIVDPNGYILTNFHVVDNAENITVTVMHKDGKRQYKAKLIGGDKQEDLAVLKIEAKGLRPVNFGDSDALRPGEWVMAIGNPFGFEHTVSVGVVSALNRSLPVNDSVTLRNMIQTDASINPGNSGGPLVNLRGEVVGIDSAMFVGQGGGTPQANGIGFAIPSTHAKAIMEQLRRGEKVAHPFVGISYAPITDEMRRESHLPVKDGVLVAAVLADGPAGKAGIKRGDVITGIDGKELRDLKDFGDHISAQPVGKDIKLDVRRWNEGSGEWEQKTLTVKIGNRPADFEERMQTQRGQQMPERQGPGTDGEGEGLFPILP